MTTDNLPRLSLIIEQHIKKVKYYNIDYRYPIFRFRVFSQVWPSTALGFSRVGVKTLTVAYTTVVEDDYGFYSVFFGESFAYLIKNPSDIFFEDMNRCYMKPVSEFELYY